MTIKEIRDSFKSCIEVWGGYPRKCTCQPQIIDAFNQITTQSEINALPFVGRLLKLDLSLIDVDKIRNIANICFRFPKIQCFFNETAPTGKIGKEINPQSALYRIRKAFLKSCLHRCRTEFDEALDREFITFPDFAPNHQVKLRKYTELCGIVDTSRSLAQVPEPSSSQTTLTSLQRIIPTTSSDIRASFESCLRVWTNISYQWADTGFFIALVTDAFKQVDTESGFNESSFRKTLSDKTILTNLEVEKIISIAKACYAFPKIHYFFDDTASTGRVCQKMMKQGVVGIPECCLNTIREAFFKSCLDQSPTEFQQALTSAANCFLFKAKHQVKLKRYLELCGISVAAAPSAPAAAAPAAAPVINGTQKIYPALNSSPDTSLKRAHPSQKETAEASYSAPPPQKVAAYAFPVRLSIPESFFDDCQRILSEIEKNSEAKECVTQVSTWMSDLKKKNDFKNPQALLIEIQSFLEKVQELKEAERIKDSSASAASAEASSLKEQKSAKIDELMQVIKTAMKDMIDLIMQTQQ